MERDWTGESRATIAEAARRHGFEEGAGFAMADALVASGGAMAQFRHPALGGMGQWSGGGMLMIGDMFNDALKARVRALAEDLAAELRRDGLTFEAASAASPNGSGGSGRWWPEELGQPSSTGAQNGRRYAVFPETRRLAVETDGKVTVYDTGDHTIGGVSQQQGSTDSLRFGSDRGQIGVSNLAEIRAAALEEHRAKPAAGGEHAAHSSWSETERSADLKPGASASGGDPLELLQRLAELRTKGVISDDEFATKKVELLARI